LTGSRAILAVAVTLGPWARRAATALCLAACAGIARAEPVALPDDLHLPPPRAARSEGDHPMLGAWAGDAWSGVLPAVLVVESVTGDGQATVVYAVGDAPEWKITPGWSRVTARIADGALSFTLRGGAARVRYVLTADGRLEGHFDTGRSAALVVLRRVEPASRDALARLVADETYRVEPEQIFIPVKTGTGTELRLEATLYRPDRSGRFPLVLFNHGSTGPGAIPATLTLTFRAPAHYFVRRGFAVVVPMRKGRGASEGSYDEPYGCAPGVIDAGVASGLADLDGVLDHLLQQAYVDGDRLLIAGQSRGGYLSVVYAARGRHRDRLRAVINFAGGWTSQRCGDLNSPGYADAGSRTRLPMLWLYGEGDSYYSSFAIRGYFEAFEKVGGNGRLVLHGGLPGDGHRLVDFVPVWKPDVDRFLASLGF
jgi:dienelactone hydrolase